ncbi:6091_t:CDS:1, partial [Acaulospora colombiana]
PSEGDSSSYAQTIGSLRVERIIVLGLEKKPTKILAYHNSEPSAVNVVRFEVGGMGTAISASTPSTDVLVIKDPKLSITKDWTMEFLN